MRLTSDYRKNVALFLIPILILTSLVFGCGSSDEVGTNGEPTNELPPGVTIKPVESATPTIKEPEELNLEKAQGVMEEFLCASDLHIKGEYSSIVVGGMTDGPTAIEVWVKGEKVRMDDTRSNGPRTLIVADGKATYYMYDSKHVLSALMPAEEYTDMYGLDFALATSRVSDDGKSAVFSIDVNKFYKNDNAQAGYYVTKMEYIVDNNRVMSQTTYGKDSYGTKPPAVNRVTQTFSLVEINKGIADTVFDPPF